MIYLGLILKIVGLWSTIAFSLVGLWCALRWLADRRARANVAPFQREWPIAQARLDWNVGRGDPNAADPADGPFTSQVKAILRGDPYTVGSERLLDADGSVLRVTERASGGEAA